jgi:hypothetical protein
VPGRADVDLRGVELAGSEESHGNQAAACQVDGVRISTRLDVDLHRHGTEVVVPCQGEVVTGGLLFGQGKEELAYAAPFATYAIKQVRSGRRVGSRLNARDVSSPHCQIRKGIRLGRLDHFDKDSEERQEILIVAPLHKGLFR